MARPLKPDTRLPWDSSSQTMVCWMRLALAIAAFMLRSVDSVLNNPFTFLNRIVFFGYVAYSVILFGLSMKKHRFAETRLICWLDLGWVMAMVVCTGGSNSYLFPFFFFAILTTAFRWGFEECAKIVLTTTTLYSTIAFVSLTSPEILPILLRTSFLLSLGYMIAYWGGSEVTHKRQLALLRDVNDLSNPRFGVDRTTVSVLEKTAAYFNAARCVLITREHQSSSWSLRTVTQHNGKFVHSHEEIGDVVASSLLTLPVSATVLYSGPLLRFLHAYGAVGEYRTFDDDSGLWEKSEESTASYLSALLETHSFISAPLSLREGEGRIFVTAISGEFKKSDALFLVDIEAQAFPVIESIKLLDRLASDASTHERERIGRDLHDSAVQSCIGLKNGISALRNKAAGGNLLISDLDKLVAEATYVIGNLRSFAGSLRTTSLESKPFLKSALQREAAHTREFYGIDVAINVADACEMNDRLAGEVFQIVSEGIANICKHTNATSCVVDIAIVDNNLVVRIDNDRAGQPIFVPSFTPRSITERAAALGGNAHVACVSEHTEIHVAIPV